MTQHVPRGRSISQILSRAGYPSAGIRQRRCGFIVPDGAHGFGCAEVTVGPWPETSHQWRGVQISWYGPDHAPFEQVSDLLADRGFTSGRVDPRSLMTGVPSLTVWFDGADAEPESV